MRRIPSPTAQQPSTEAAHPSDPTLCSTDLGDTRNDARTAFARACTDQGRNDAHCTCVMDQLATTLLATDLAAYEQVIVEGTDAPQPQQVTDTMARCSR